MNSDWKNFLLSVPADFETDTQISFKVHTTQNKPTIYPLAHLTVLKISGKDAAHLLQGQLTCNVHELNETLGNLGALCNPKGRAIATFLLIKTDGSFLMVLPVELLQIIKKRLNQYILRSEVSLTDCSDELCLLGLSTSEIAEATLSGTSPQGLITINLGKRQLIVCSAGQAISLWQEKIGCGFQTAGSAHWRYLDIISGLPWLTTETSEVFIPQMLNLDKLGGISFNKGCYTGQEIIARSHYLGKTKRAMFLAEANTANTPAPNSIIFDDQPMPDTTNTTNELEQTTGRVLLAQQHDTGCKMLIVIQISETGNYQLKLADSTPLTLLPLNQAI